MSNPFVAHNRLPFNFVDGISVGGVDLAGPEGSSKIGYSNGTVKDALGSTVDVFNIRRNGGDSTGVNLSDASFIAGAASGKPLYFF